MDKLDKMEYEAENREELDICNLTPYQKSSTSVMSQVVRI